MTDMTQIAGSFAIVTKITSGCCGEITLPQGSEAIFNGDLLTGEAIKSGAIKWFPDEYLKFKGRTSRAIDRAFQEFGMDWGGICLVPTASLDALMQKVNSIINRFFADLDALEPRYDAIVAAHAQNQIPAVKSLIESSKLPWQEFRKRFHCYVPRPSIFTPIGVDNVDAQKEVQAGLQDAALADIVSKSTVIRNSIIGRDKVDSRSIEPLKRLVEKCRTYGIINPAFGQLANEFDAFAATLLPPLAGDKLRNLSNFVTLLSSPDAIAAFIANRSSDQAAKSIDDILGLNVPVSTQVNAQIDMPVDAGVEVVANTQIDVTTANAAVASSSVPVTDFSIAEIGRAHV